MVLIPNSIESSHVLTINPKIKILSSYDSIYHFLDLSKSFFSKLDKTITYIIQVFSFLL